MGHPVRTLAIAALVMSSLPAHAQDASWGGMVNARYRVDAPAAGDTTSGAELQAARL